MAIAFEVSIQGWTPLSRRLMRNSIRRALTRTAKWTLYRVLAKTPVRTGRLYRSTNYQVHTYTAVVFAATPYAPFVEERRRMFADQVEPVADRAEQEIARELEL